MNFKMKALLTIFIIFAIVFMVACGNTEDNSGGAVADAPRGESPAEVSPPAVEEPKEHVTIRFQNWAQSDTYDAVNQAFMEEHPHITVEWVFSGNQREGLEESIASGNPIDVFFNPDFQGLVRENFIEDLTPWIESDPEFRAYNFLPGTMENFNVSGGQWALPRGTEVFLVFVNLDLLEQYGLKLPSFDWTFEDMRQMAIAATNPAEGHYGLGSSAIAWWILNAVLPAANGSAPNLMWLNEDLTVMLSNQPDVLDDLNWIRDLIDADGILLDGPAQGEAGVGGSLFEEGQALFNIHVSPLMESWAKAPLPFKFDVLPLPGGTKRQIGGMLWSQPLMMTKAGKNKDAVWEFMKWYTTSPRAQEIFLAEATLLPNTSDSDTQQLLRTLPFYDNFNVDAIFYALERAEVDPVITAPVGDVMNAGFGEYIWDKGWGEGNNPYDVLPEITERINGEIQMRLAEM